VSPSTPPEAPPRQDKPAVPIDPRIRQRRIEVRRDEGRRRRRVILILVGFVLVLLLGWGIIHTPLVDVDTFRVTGTTRTTPELVVAASGLHKGMPMLDVHVDTARQKVQAMPWVLKAKVERHWPGTVTIDVRERQPVAALAAPAGIAVVDGSGRVLAVGPTPPAGVPLLLGLPPAGAPGTHIAGRAADLLAVARAIPPAVVGKVAGVAAADGGQVELRLRPSGVVRLGPPEKLSEKMLAVETVLSQVDLSRLAVLDVRVPASPAITRA
jgi:cell division protein FtsQ